MLSRNTVSESTIVLRLGAEVFCFGLESSSFIEYCRVELLLCTHLNDCYPITIEDSFPHELLDFLCSAVLHMSDTTRAKRWSVSMSCSIFDALFVMRTI